MIRYIRLRRLILYRRIDVLTFIVGFAIGAGILTGVLPCLLAIRIRLDKPANWKPLLPGGIPLTIVTLLFYLLGISWYITHP